MCCCAVRFVQKVKQEHGAVLETHAGIDLSAVGAAKTLSDFDGAAVAPMMGEPSASQYYRVASAGRLLNCISTPTLIVQKQLHSPRSIANPNH